MLFNAHSELLGQHAFLAASKYHWINYDADKLLETYLNHRAAVLGSELHDFACHCIRLGRKQPRNGDSLNQYVNDAIGFKMTPEQVLRYSRNCYGTADAIGFKNNLLRIHDLKTGINPGSFHQLEVYAAIFCLEYRYRPAQIDMEFRIYQSGEVLVQQGSADVITHIIDRIVTFDKMIEKLREETS